MTKAELTLIKHDFSEKELLELSRDMVCAQNRAYELEDQRKSSDADFKGKIKAEELVVKECSRKVHDGYEMRREPCTVEYDNENRVVRYYRQDNGRLAKERAMTPEEMQQELPI